MIPFPVNEGEKIPTLKKNIRPYSFPKGSRTAIGRCEVKYTGKIEAATKAISLARLNWRKEHGELPPEDEWILVTVSYTTYEVLAEIVCQPVQNDIPYRVKGGFTVI